MKFITPNPMAHLREISLIRAENRGFSAESDHFCEIRQNFRGELQGFYGNYFAIKYYLK